MLHQIVSVSWIVISAFSIIVASDFIFLYWTYKWGEWAFEMFASCMRFLIGLSHLYLQCLHVPNICNPVQLCTQNANYMSYVFMSIALVSFSLCKAWSIACIFRARHSHTHTHIHPLLNCAWTHKLFDITF